MSCIFLFSNLYFVCLFLSFVTRDSFNSSKWCQGYKIFKNNTKICDYLINQWNVFIEYSITKIFNNCSPTLFTHVSFLFTHVSHFLLRCTLRFALPLRANWVLWIWIVVLSCCHHRSRLWPWYPAQVSWCHFQLCWRAGLCRHDHQTSPLPRVHQAQRWEAEWGDAV